MKGISGDKFNTTQIFFNNVYDASLRIRVTSPAENPCMKVQSVVPFLWSLYVVGTTIIKK